MQGTGGGLPGALRAVLIMCVTTTGAKQLIFVQIAVRWERELLRVQPVAAQPGRRINCRTAARVYLEMQVRSGRVTRATNSTNFVSGLDDTVGYQRFGQVAIPGLGVVPVLDPNAPAVAAGPAGVDDPATR